MNKRNLWSRILTIAGGIAIVAGAIDPIDGALLSVLGGGLFALGAYLGQAERRVIAYKVLAFIMMAIGFGVFWKLIVVEGMRLGPSAWPNSRLFPPLPSYNVGLLPKGH